jgi:hypothetical protein
LSLARHTLLDEATGQVGIDDTALGADDCITQGCIVDLLLAREPREIPRLEDPQAASHVAKLCISRGDIIQ